MQSQAFGRPPKAVGSLGGALNGQAEGHAEGARFSRHLGFGANLSQETVQRRHEWQVNYARGPSW